MPRLLRSTAFRIAALALVLGLGFLGSRGIWDPDEGRYTNVALNMLDSGDWINPRRSHEVGHWTKPPLTYWAIAASIRVLGANPWAARLPSALAFLLCTWLAWRVARRIAPGSEAPAAVVYATMAFTVGASQMITTDYVLSACVGVAMWAFVEARFAARKAPHWLVLMWAALALAFIAKGPPALVYLLVVVVFDWLMPPRRDHRAFHAAGLAVFVLLALPWYIAVIAGHPGLFRYFIGDEVVNRVATNEFGRHGEWYGWLTVYGPTLLIGTLPWTPVLWRWACRLPSRLREWQVPAARASDGGTLLLATWILLPLLVFCLARSRLPLYLLPLFLPMAVAIGTQWRKEGRALRWRWLLAWTAVLLGLKFAAAQWPTHKDASAWAEAIRARVPGAIGEVVFVEDMARYGLHLHLGTHVQVEKVSLAPQHPAAFNPPFDETLAMELAEHEPGVVWICKEDAWPALRARIAALGYEARQDGTPYRDRIVFTVAPKR